MAKRSKRNLEAEIDDLREQVSMLDTMLSSIVDVMEAKGLMTHAEWEKKIKENLDSR
jgi:hypothetical protein